jgi:hypothetical protein
MSSMHYTGEKINVFGGITVILKYVFKLIHKRKFVNTEYLKIRNDHHYEELETEDKLAMLSLNDKKVQMYLRGERK